MKLKLLLWILFFPLVLFFLVMFFIEVSLSSELGGVSFWIELKNVWFRSIWFYALIAVISFLFCFSFLNKRKQ